MASSLPNSGFNNSATARPVIASPVDVVRILLKRKRLVIAIGFVVVALATAAAFLMPKSYESELVLFVRKGRESVGLDPTATTGGITSVYETREQELNSVLDILRSRTLLDAVVDQIGEDALLDHRKFVRPIQQTENKDTVPEVSVDQGRRPDTSEARQRAIKALAAAISVDNGKQSSVISVAAKSGSPELAQAINSAFLDAFKREYLRVNQTSGSLAFFERQSAQLGEQLEVALAELSESKNRVGVASLDGQRGILEQRLNVIDQDVATSSADLAATSAKLEKLRESLESLPHRTAANDAGDATHRRLNELRLTEQQLIRKYTELHPLVIDIRKQITRAEQLVSDPTNAGNPSARELELLIANERAHEASLSARLKELRTQRSTVAGQLAKLNSEEPAVIALRERIDHLKSNWHSATQKREEARLLGALADDRISNVNVVQFPSFNPKSVGPGKTTVLGLGIVLAGLSGIGVALLIEFFQPIEQASSLASSHEAHAPQIDTDAKTVSSQEHDEADDLAIVRSLGPRTAAAIQRPLTADQLMLDNDLPLESLTEPPAWSPQHASAATTTTR